MSATSLKLTPSIGFSWTDALEYSLVNWLQWGLLNAGGFFDSPASQPGAYAADLSALRPAKQPGVADGTIWEGIRKDWVWETGIDYPTQPLAVTGVSVGSVFRPLASGCGYRVNFPLGQVRFDTPLPVDSVVRCGHSWRLYQIYDSDPLWWKQLQTRSFRADGPDWTQNTGIRDVLAQNRVQLPAVIVDVRSTARTTPRQLGGGEIVEREVLFQIVAEEKWHKRWLHDAVVAQQDTRFFALDRERMLADGFSPLDEFGSPNSNSLYPLLIRPAPTGYRSRVVRCAKMVSFDQPDVGGIQFCTVAGTFSADF